jgi:hypothetical protein
LAHLWWLTPSGRFAKLDQAAMDHLFFDEAGITVTNTRLVVPGQVHSLRDVQAAHVLLSRHDRAVPMTLMIAGVALGATGLFIASGAGAFLGLMMVVVGWIAWRFQDIVHRVILVGPAGEVVAFVNADAALVQRVAAATVAALAARPSTMSNPKSRSATP